MPPSLPQPLIVPTHQQAEKSKLILKLIICEENILFFREDIKDVLIVHAGRTNPRLLGVQQRKIEEYIRHPDFNYRDTGYYFDIALLILDKVTNTFCFYSMFFS